MKKLFLVLSSTLLAAILMSSCSGGLTVQKRKHSKGFFITSTKKVKWGNSKATNEEPSLVNNSVEENNTSKKEIITEEKPVSLTVENKINHSSNTPNEATTIENTNKKLTNTTLTSQPVSKIEDKTSTNTSSKKKTALKTKLAKKMVTPWNDGEETILLVILSIFIPPLAVYLYEGVTGRFWIDLIAVLIAVAGWWYLRLSGLLWFFAVIYALLIVLGVI